MRWAPAYEIIGNGAVQNNIEDKYEELAKKDIDWSVNYLKKMKWHIWIVDLKIVIIYNYHNEVHK